MSRVHVKATRATNILARGAAAYPVRSIPSTPEQRQWARDLAASRPELGPTDISRLFTRTFGFVVGAKMIGVWLRAAR